MELLSEGFQAEVTEMQPKVKSWAITHMGNDTCILMVQS
jgi:hypothetical protein